MARSDRLTREAALAAALRDCAARIEAAGAKVAEDDAPEGPHALRIALRRARAVLALRRGDGSRALAARARDLGGRLSDLRDLDVLVGAADAAAAEDPEGGPALAEALKARRAKAQTAAREALAGEGALPGDLAAAADGARWRNPAKAVDRRWRTLRKTGARLDALDAEERHEMRKALKKLRYGAELAAGDPPARAARKFLKRLKRLQDAFGAVNDAATAAAILTGPGAPLPDDPAAQRAAGRILGGRAAAAEREWAHASALWRRLEREGPFWR